MAVVKNTAKNLDSYVTDVPKVKVIFDKNSISVRINLLWLPWHQFQLDVELIAGQFQTQGQKIS